MQNVAIVGLYLSTLGLSVTNVLDVASSQGLVQTGTLLSQLGVPALLGVIACASVYGLVKVFLIYKQAMDEHNKSLNDLIKANTEAITKLTYSVDNQNRTVERLDNIVAGCNKRNP